jgi:hypothetical protein
VVSGELYLSLGQDIIFLDISQRLVVVPLEEVGEVVEVVGHEGVEAVAVSQEEHAVGDQVVDELAEHHLLPHSPAQLEQSPLDLAQSQHVINPRSFMSMLSNPCKMVVISLGRS